MNDDDLDPGTRAYRKKAAKASRRLRNAILRAKGYEVPRAPKKPRPVPVFDATMPLIGRPPAAANKKPDRSAEIRQIKLAVAQTCGVGVRSIQGPRRRARTVRARQLTMYALRKKLGLSFPDIGKALGGRHHTTIIYGCGEVEAQLAANDPVAIRVLNAVLHG